jgi:hypothetical protein
MGCYKRRRPRSEEEQCARRPELKGRGRGAWQTTMARRWAGQRHGAAGEERVEIRHAPCAALCRGMRGSELLAAGSRGGRGEIVVVTLPSSLMQDKPIFCVQLTKQTHSPACTKRSGIAKCNLCISWTWPIWHEVGSRA